MAKKVFICGPMTGLPDNNFSVFNATARFYRKAGFEVFNPAENGPLDTHANYLRASIQQVCQCDIIHMLPGWESSEGACAELAVAKVCGLDLEGNIVSKSDTLINAAETILDEAARITSGTRNKEYGEPKDNHKCTANLWNTYLTRKYAIYDIEISERDVCILNILQKISRDANMEKRDNLVDICGWARNIEMLD